MTTEACDTNRAQLALMLMREMTDDEIRRLTARERYELIQRCWHWGSLAASDRFLYPEDYEPTNALERGIAAARGIELELEPDQLFGLVGRQYRVLRALAIGGVALAWFGALCWWLL